MSEDAAVTRARPTEEPPGDHWDRVAEAFSRKSVEYDVFALDHPNQTRMRGRVYANLEPFLAPGARILELNAGTGTDAVYLATRGFQVHATDIAPGMLAAIEQKAGSAGVSGRLTSQSCSFTSLDQVAGGPYDAVFSNFGGLNCVADLGLVARHMDRLVVPGGIVTWVIMPPICPWELQAVKSGNWRYAFRRLRRGGVLAHVSGVYFQTYYHAATQVVRALGPSYSLIRQEGLSVFCPPADHKDFAVRFPRLYCLFARLDSWLATIPPFRGWGDFVILSFRRRSP